MESLYSSGSLKSAAGRRKPQRQAGIMHGNNDVRQRVISARLLRVKNLQNQLNDAMQHIAVGVSSVKTPPSSFFGISLLPDVGRREPFASNVAQTSGLRIVQI